MIFKFFLSNSDSHSFHDRDSLMSTKIHDGFLSDSGGFVFHENNVLMFEEEEILLFIALTWPIGQHVHKTT